MDRENIFRGALETIKSRPQGTAHHPITPPLVKITRLNTLLLVTMIIVEVLIAIDLFFM